VTADLETRRKTTSQPLVEAVSPQRLPRIAVLGAGHVGPVIARAAIAAGYQVAIAATGDPANISLIIQVLAPGAEPRWAADAVQESDVVVLAIPLHKFATFDPSLVTDKIVVDAMNYWPPRRWRGGSTRKTPIWWWASSMLPASPVSASCASTSATTVVPEKSKRCATS
jgi:predicted dinucleotide-binding enzyme